MAHGDPDALLPNPHGQWHEHSQEQRLWRNVPACTANNTMRRIMTASRQDTEKMLNHDGTTTTGTLGHHQMVVVGPPTVSISANATVAGAPAYLPNAK